MLQLPPRFAILPEHKNVGERRHGESIGAARSTGDRQGAAARRWITELAIRCRDGAQPVGELSGGNQQKVAIARLLEHPARILLLDEPTRGIDVGSKAQIYQLIGRLAAEGRAVIVVSSYLPELLGLCDTIGVMCRGELVEVRPRSEWNEAAIMRVATGGGDAAAGRREG